MTELVHADTVSDLSEVLDSNPVVLVEFGASWCGPCRQFLPHFTKFAAKHPEIVCVKVDIDVDHQMSRDYDIMSVPQVMLFENGKYVKHVAENPAERTVIKLEQALTEYTD